MILHQNQCEANASYRFGLKINVQNYEKSAFESNIKTDPLLREIIKDHVIFGNVEFFVDSVVK